MTSAQRRGSGPVRQHSLQQPARRHHQMRRQRSAEEDRALQIRTTDPIRARRENDRSNADRPKIRIAWGDENRLEDDPDGGRVEVVACQIATSGKPRSATNGRQSINSNRNSGAEKACSTLLYSRQELAERLRLAWKQREANKSNIDVFLAHETTEERSDSRLSSSSSVDRSPVRNFEKKSDGKNNENAIGRNEVDKIGSVEGFFEKKSDGKNNENAIRRNEVEKIGSVGGFFGKKSDGKNNENAIGRNEVEKIGSVGGFFEKKSDGKNNNNAIRRNEVDKIGSVGGFFEKKSDGKNNENAIRRNEVDKIGSVEGFFEKKSDGKNNENAIRRNEVDKIGSVGGFFEKKSDGKNNENAIRRNEVDKIGSVEGFFEKKSDGKNNDNAIRRNEVEKIGSVEGFSTTSGSSEGAKSKRASFKSGSNSAFLELANDSVEGFSTASEAIQAKVSVLDKNRRTNSAPPQRRANSVGASCRTQVSIVIEAPGVSKPDLEDGIPTECVEPGSGSTRISGISGGRPIKSAPAKRRARSGKRRANSAAGRGDLDGGRAKVAGNDGAKNSEVVTMVSLVSDADSDSEVEEISPRDDKLISQLRSNLPTTPIIKNTVVACGSSSSVARRPIKSVSFQQDSIDLEEPEKRNLRVRPQSVQVGRVTGSALPTPEEARTWRTEVTTLTISTSSTIRQHYESQELADVSLTDREKRCLVVPIGDPRSDKKRKLLRTKSTPQPPRNGIEKPTAMHQSETGESPPRSGMPAVLENPLPIQQTNSILLQTSVSKLVENVVITGSSGEPEVDADPVEPAFQTTKEKECWHLYRRMCDKGVCVSFDTVLRGMLTPTEYRLRRKEVT